MSQLSETLTAPSVLALLAPSLGYFLSSWRDIDQDTGLFGRTEPEAYNMRSMGTSSPVVEYVVRPHAQILCIVAAFLRTEEGRRQLAAVVAPGEAERRVAAGLRWLVQTHLTGERDVGEFLGRRRWGENWRSALWASQVALCAHLCRDFLSGDVAEGVRRVLAFEAGRFVGVLPPSGCEVDTKVEENAIDAMVLAWAINTVPEHPDAEQWEQALRVWAVNIATTPEDRADHTEYNGRSVASWVMTQTLYPDLTADNHGFFHPEVLTYTAWVVLAMAAYTFNGRPAPACLRRAVHQKTYDLLLRFCLPTGMLLAPGGQDLPLFVPRPFALAWGLWHSDPRALRLTERLLAWMQQVRRNGDAGDEPWVYGLERASDGWALHFQSLVGFELAMLAVLPPPTPEMRFYSPGQVESAVDTRRIYPCVQLCYRRNTRTTRSVAWKALGHHPVVGLVLHDAPELTVTSRAAMLGVPVTAPAIRRWTVLHHSDRYHRDGFDTAGRIVYADEHGATLLRRDMRVVTWGDEGLLVLDEITAETALRIEEQYLSPVYIVNDRWTGDRVLLSSGSLQETMPSMPERRRTVSCPSYWASVNNALLVQMVWGLTKGLVYVPAGQRNTPPYWKNCCVDMLAVRVDSADIGPGENAYRLAYYVGAGKGPRPLKTSGEAGPYFRGLVIMDGRNTLGLD